MPISRQMDKKAVVHIHNGILLSCYKEYIWISSNEMDETGAHYTEWRVSQKGKHQYSILTHIYGIYKDGNEDPICKTEKETQMYRTDFWTLWEKARVGWSERTASKHHVYYQVRNRSPVQVGCMRQVLRAGALGWPRGMGWGGKWEGGSGWGTHVNPWLIHVNVWQNPLQYCKVISLQLIKINEKKKNS